ncbi:MAG: DUF4124 domain-containing protein [Nitrospira sp.]|nr:DUF4124 domain-containing protein [Nitrospira sp.]
MKRTAYRLRSIRPWLGWIMLAGLLLLGIDPYPFQAHATTIYSYIDEQGNPRFSDSMENIPEKYRAKVKTHEQATPQEHPPSALDSVRAVVSPSAIASFKQKIAELLQGFGIALPSASMKTASVPSTAPTSDMNSSQSQIVNYAGAAAVVLLLVMYFSKSQLMRLLALCLLVTLGVATPILLYVSDDGPMTSMKGRVTAVGQAQQDRFKQVGH